MNKLMTLAAGLALAVAGPSVVSAAQNTHPDAAVKVASGIIAGNGAIVLGKGFTSVHNGTGSYTLTWPAGYFKTCPAVSVTPAGTNGDFPIANLLGYGCGSSGVQINVIVVGRGSGNGQDNAFHFTLNAI